MLWFAVACVSVALNALLLQKLLAQEMPTLPVENLEGRNASVSASAEIANLTAREVAELGQLFFHQKVSELLMTKDVQAEINFNNESWQKETPMVGLALELLSVELELPGTCWEGISCWRHLNVA